jgi:hypothetical protein
MSSRKIWKYIQSRSSVKVAGCQDSKEPAGICLLPYIANIPSYTVIISIEAKTKSAVSLFVVADQSATIYRRKYAKKTAVKT